MRAHYHVHVGMRGYLPNQSYYASTRKEAEAIAKQEAADFAEAWLYPVPNPSHTRNVRMVGSARSGWYEGPGDLSYHYIEIVACTDACDPEDSEF